MPCLLFLHEHLKPRTGLLRVIWTQELLFASKTCPDEQLAQEIIICFERSTNQNQKWNCMKKKDDHYFSERTRQSHLDKGFFYCAEKALCATLCSHSHTHSHSHMHRSLPLPCSVKASFACHRRAVQWKRFLISTTEKSYLPPLIQEKDTELQTVSIPDILFPAPKLPFPFLKKWKPWHLNQQGPRIPASQEFATGQLTKSHHQTSLSFSLWRKQLWLLLEPWQTSPNTALHKTHASWLLLEIWFLHLWRWRS